MTSFLDTQPVENKEDLLEALLAGCPPHSEGRIDLRGANLAATDLSGLNLANAMLADADLSGANLSGANLMGADLSKAKLFTANLQESLLTGATLNGAELSGSDLTGASMENVQAKQAGFGMACLKDVNLERACLDESTLSGANLNNANLGKASLQNTRLRDVDLRGANLHGADMRGVHLSLSQVEGASFRNVDLRGARMRMMRGYQHADWIGVDIRDISFSGSLMMRRFMMDQNYIMEYRQSSRLAAFLYYPWLITSDCGRSLSRWCGMIVILASVFAMIYRKVGIDFGEYETAYSPFYFSVVTITTLGYGDVLPMTVAGQAATMFEVVVGYIMLGGLLAIFSNKIARRAE